MVLDRADGEGLQLTATGYLKTPMWRKPARKERMEAMEHRHGANEQAGEQKYGDTGWHVSCLDALQARSQGARSLPKQERDCHGGHIPSDRSGPRRPSPMR